MYWECKSCGSKNPENSRACGKCGKTTDAPKKFYAASIVGAAIVFVLIYIVGTSIGGTLIAFGLEPTDEQVLATAKETNPDAKSLLSLDSDQRDEARAATIEKARTNMSVLSYAILFWFIPFLLFPIIGLVVGFISQGRTVLEAAIGSVVGQGLGFVGMRVMYDADIGFIELGVGLVVGFFTVAAGAYVGEAIQEKRERASLQEMDEEVY